MLNSHPWALVWLAVWIIPFEEKNLFTHRKNIEFYSGLENGVQNGGNAVIDPDHTETFWLVFTLSPSCYFYNGI